MGDLDWIGAAADLSRGAPVGWSGEGCRCQPYFDQPDQFRVGPRRSSGPTSLPSASRESPSSPSSPIETGKQVERQQMLATGDGKPLSFRFQFRPERKGVNFYQVHAFAASDEKKPDQAAGTDATTSEQTLANNSRLVVIDQGGGPYRVLYVSGRPNWEYKFLRRALEDDDQIELVGLVRIARRQPKFDFRSQRSQSTSPLFDGFDHPDAETAERADESVVIRLGKKLDGVELRDELSQDGRRALPLSRDRARRYRSRIFHPGPARTHPEFREPARRWSADAGGPRFVRERQIRPHPDRRALACLSQSVRDGPG